MLRADVRGLLSPAAQTARCGGGKLWRRRRRGIWKRRPCVACYSLLVSEREVGAHVCYGDAAVAGGWGREFPPPLPCTKVLANQQQQPQFPSLLHRRQLPKPKPQRQISRSNLPPLLQLSVVPSPSRLVLRTRRHLMSLLCSSCSSSSSTCCCRVSCEPSRHCAPVPSLPPPPAPKTRHSCSLRAQFWRFCRNRHAAAIAPKGMQRQPPPQVRCKRRAYSVLHVAPVTCHTSHASHSTHVTCVTYAVQHSALLFHSVHEQQAPARCYIVNESYASRIACHTIGGNVCRMSPTARVTRAGEWCVTRAGG